MAINAIRNRCSGPGGGTRRLHQIDGLPSSYGGEIGSTRVERYSFCSALYHRYRAILINAKGKLLAVRKSADNDDRVIVNDNRLVAAAAA